MNTNISKSKILVFILLITTSFNGVGQVKKNTPLKLYKSYSCVSEVDIEDFVTTDEYLNCEKSSNFSITISKNSITILELNKINKVISKNTYSDLVCEHRDDFDVYKKIVGN